MTLSILQRGGGSSISQIHYTIESIRVGLALAADARSLAILSPPSGVDSVNVADD
jgi:hypothetical protein